MKISFARASFAHILLSLRPIPICKGEAFELVAGNVANGLLEREQKAAVPGQKDVGLVALDFHLSPRHATQAMNKLSWSHA